MNQRTAAVLRLALEGILSSDQAADFIRNVKDDPMKRRWIKLLAQVADPDRFGKAQGAAAASSS